MINIKSAANLLPLFLLFLATPTQAQIPVLESTPPPLNYEPPLPIIAPSPPPLNDIRPESSYLLGGGDRLTIDIFEVPQYSGIFQVPIDGVLFLPLIGRVDISGLTLEQATRLISSKYGAYLKRPLITIRLLNSRPLNVIVGGEVTAPGSFSINLVGGAGDNPGVQYPTLGAALKAAGGITLSADLTRVLVRRRTPNHGPEAVFTINIQELILKGDRTFDLTLRDGDTIFVPTVEVADLRQLRQLALTAFAADVEKGRTVSVVGAVDRPGSYNIIGTALVSGGATGLTGGLPTVTLALQQAGGVKPTADLRNIYLRRLTRTGTELMIPLDLWALLNTGDIAQDTVLQEGDTIVVPEASNPTTAEIAQLATAQFAPDKMRVGIVGEVGDPGLKEVPPNTTLNQALMVAGGFNRDRARRSAVRLIRLNQDGTVISRDVPVDLAQGVNEESNPILKNNDIIVVNRTRNAEISDVLNTLFIPGTGALAAFSIPSRIFGILETLGIIDFSGDNSQ